MYLYKYRNFSKHHVQSVVNNELRFSVGRVFNDPFDSQPPLFLMSTESMIKLIQSKTKTGKLIQGKDLENFSYSIIDQYKNGDTIKSLFDDMFRPIVGFISNSFIFCLSKTYSNPLMWSHYSISHSGFCVRYDLDKLLSSLNLEMHGDVIYENDVKDILNYLHNDKFNELVFSVLTQKSKDWAYEEEYRFILKEYAQSKNDLIRCVKHAEGAIDGIFFGLMSSEQDRKFLINSLSGRDIKYFNMNKSASKFELFDSPFKA